MRKPLALTNWKMEMTVTRSLAFVQDFQAAIGDLAQEVDIILCPPYTALYPMAQALKDSPITLGGQNVSTAPGGAYTGEISAALLADVGCRWVMLGHWVVRRHFGDTDETVNRKLHVAQRAGLRPILFVGEAKREQDRFREALAAQLQRVLEGCDARQIEEMVVVYEPEWTINVEEPASPEQVGAGCGFIREWLAEHHGASTARVVRIPAGEWEFIPKEFIYDVLPELAKNMIEFIKENNLEYDMFYGHYVDAGIVTLEVAKAFARQFGVTVAITGKRDIISDGERVLAEDNGDAMLKTITGTGCMATTMIAAFAAVGEDYLLAATGGLVSFGLAAEIAALQAKGPGSFKVALFDALYNLSRGQLLEGTKALLLKGE